MKRPIATLASAALAAALSHCGTHDKASADGGTIGLSREPAVHFSTPQVCGTTDGSSFGPTCSDSTQPGCACGTDAECTAGPDGACVRHGNALTATYCEYAQCFASSECAAGSTCLCAGPAPADFANECVPSNCRVDADCGPNGYCSPSVEQPGEVNCSTAGRYGGAYCRTPQDECVDDSDCADASTGRAAVCAYDLELTKWTCQKFSCLAG